MITSVGEAAGLVSHALAKKYAAPSYAYMEQVGNGTGADAYRHADAVAMCLWPSRGLEILGFEIKVHRGDWLNELRNPEKSEAVAKYCERWWIVTTPDVAKKEEMPQLWGLQVLNGGKLYIKKEAPLKKARKLDRTFLAAILRKAQEATAKTSIPRASIQAEIDAARAEGKADGESGSKWQLTEYRELVEKVERFEKESGVKIAERWGLGDVGEAVRLVRELGRDRIFGQLKGAREMLARLILDIDRRTIGLAEDLVDEEMT